MGTAKWNMGQLPALWIQAVKPKINPGRAVAIVTAFIFRITRLCIYIRLEDLLGKSFEI